MPGRINWTAVGAFGGIVMAVIMFSQWIESENKASPQIKYVGDYFKGIDHYLTFQNLSTSNVAITRFDFRIDDSQQLASIDRRQQGMEHGPVVGSANPCDPVVFDFGEWTADGSAYVFTIRRGCNIEPNHTNDFALSISNPTLAGRQFIGRVTVHFAGNGEEGTAGLKDVLVNVRR